jgi:TorA maturation chaperone TorD
MNHEKANILKGYNMLLYFAGSMIMNEPTEECVIDFWMNGKLRNLPVRSTNPRFIKAASLLREACPEKALCRQSLLNDFYRLFSVSGLPLTPPFGSIYHNRHFLNEPLPESVSDYYNSYGFSATQRGKVPDDHLGLELLFLTRMVDKYLQLDDAPCIKAMKIEIKRYIDYHILSWVPYWNDDIQEHAHSIGYKAVGTLIYACVEDIRSLMDNYNEL